MGDRPPGKGGCYGARKGVGIFNQDFLKEILNLKIFINLFFNITWK